MEENEVYEVVTAMRWFGGGFVKALGEAIMRADHINVQILKDAFPMYWEHYRNRYKEEEQRRKISESERPL